MIVVSIPPYYYKVIVVVGKEELVRYANDNDIELDFDPGVVQGFVLETLCKEGKDQCLLYLKEGFLDDVLWHEALHAVHCMMHSREVPVSYDNTEVQAYHQEWLVKEILTLLGEDTFSAVPFTDT